MMKMVFRCSALLTLVFVFLSLAARGVSAQLSESSATPPEANDHIFPAAAVAKPYIDFDAKGFLIHGKRTFVVSAGLEYARLPHELWHDRLLRLKRAGFNTVEIYTFWDYHEPHEGQFDFSGDHDLNAFLQMVHAMGMYAIVRVGPFYCAEWTSGGYPLWLRDKPGLLVRRDNAQFLKYVDRFFARLIPIVASNQINRGGAVILVQLENEHPLAWGTTEANGYFVHLRRTALSLGLQVPYFFSGMHHGRDPAGSDVTLDEPSRPNPWITTELWSVFFNQYGSGEKEAQIYDRRVWKILAHGGQGYNIYMGYGGSNFGYTNDYEDAASYDYGAAVGQAGDLRPLYYRFKRAGYFAQSFAGILENSSDANAETRAAATNDAVKSWGRQGPKGSIVFLDNDTGTVQETKLHLGGKILPSGGSLTLSAGEILGVVLNFPLSPQVSIARAPVRILGTAKTPAQTTLVLYGMPASPAEVQFATTARASISQGAQNLVVSSHAVALHTKFPSSGVSVSSFTVGGYSVRVLAMSTELADRTWFVDSGVAQYIVTGPDYVGDVRLTPAGLQLDAEKPWNDKTDFPALLFDGTGEHELSVSPAAASMRAETLQLGSWQTKSGTLPAKPSYDDTTWLSSREPKQMGADGDLTADAWYRTSVTVPEDGEYLLHVQGAGDRGTAFVDGKPAGSGSIAGGDLSMHLPSGRHQLAVFTAHDGRHKFGGYTGEIDQLDMKGLAGDATLLQGTSLQLEHWKIIHVTENEKPIDPPPDPADPRWRRYVVPNNAFGRKAGYAWFQTTMRVPVAQHHILHLVSANDVATVYIEGKVVAHHVPGAPFFDVNLDGEVKEGATVTLSMLFENASGAAGLYSPPTLRSYNGVPISVTGWHLHGGPGDPESREGWSPLDNDTQFDGPQFFRTTFTQVPTPGSHPIWRVLPDGLGHGSVWVNGHNLGRYPEKISLDGLYIPECWMHKGENLLVIFDEDGKHPDHVTVHVEQAASRDVYTLTLSKRSEGKPM